jgi:5-methylcytosine-specific restriction endonuclease McrA
MDTGSEQEIGTTIFSEMKHQKTMNVVRGIVRNTLAVFKDRRGSSGTRRKAYEAYMKSAKWKNKRANKLKANPSCEMCGGKDGLQVHHLNYERLGRERWKDVITLCGVCHIVEHSIESDGRKAEIFRFRDKQNRQPGQACRLGDKVVRENRHRRIERNICARY